MHNQPSRAWKSCDVHRLGDAGFELTPFRGERLQRNYAPGGARFQVQLLG